MARLQQKCYYKFRTVHIQTQNFNNRKERVKWTEL